MSVDLKRSKIIAIALHPGWIQTDMGGPKAPLTLDQAIPMIISLMEGLTMKQNGKFLQYDGKELPW
jgi:NAD(P)-dependent dehydrogenase (short-subunit alcohol dehydrogenase family)